MTGMIPVFVNERAVVLEPGATVAAAVAAFDPALAERVEAGTAQVTDGRGIELAPGTVVYPGAIVRVVLSARRERDGTNAHP